MIQVLIVDDHKVFREGIATLLEKHQNISVIAEASNKQEIFFNLESKKIDVVLMDISLNNENGIELSKQLLAEYENLPILALSMHNEPHYIIEMIEAGASGYLLKDTGSSELCEAIETVFKGGTYFRGKIAGVMLDKLRNKTIKKTPSKANIPLSKRETQVLKLIVDEYSNQEIADELFISIRTVETHKRNLIEKLEVKNTTGLVKYAIKHKIVEIN